MSYVPRSTDGVSALIAHATTTLESARLVEIFSPLFPEVSPWDALVDIPNSTAKQHAPRLKVIAKEIYSLKKSLTATAGLFGPYIKLNEAGIREVALRYASIRAPVTEKIKWAEHMLRSPIPGDTADIQLKRVNDAKFWRRAIRVILMREREHFFLRLRLVGKTSEAYVSDAQLATRLGQLRAQEKWMKDTVLIPRYLEPGALEKGALTLHAVAGSPRLRFSKLYAFTKAMDALAQENGLESGMLTITLEPEWHPNPSHGSNSWNGESPRAAHRSMAKRWQSVLRDLDRQGVGVSGLRVVEPHKDACPHWHIWLLYRPDAEPRILATVMKYFPNKLKVRAPSRKGEKNTKLDEIYDTLTDLRAGVGRVPMHAKEGAQVELSRIDRAISSGASYAMKYLLKTVDAGDELNKEVGLLPETEGEAETKRKRKEHQAAARRVDAYRSLWGINAGQLFGVAKCLTAWDEFRRLAEAPSDPFLKKLWALARGSEKEGRIAAGADQRGDAKGFIQALGGLAACGKPPKGSVRLLVGRLTEQAHNGYGELISKTKGVTLIERWAVKGIKISQAPRDDGTVRFQTVWRSAQRVVASVKSRLQSWTLVPKKHEKSALRQAEQRLAAQAYS